MVIIKEKVFVLKRILLFVLINSSILAQSILTDSTKLKETEFQSEYAISPLKDKIVIVREQLNVLDKSYLHKKRHIESKIIYSIWFINLQNGNPKYLTKFDDEDTGINNPSWSPDGKWISFSTYSIGGHSPETSTSSWVIDSSGNNLQRIKLPEPFRHFSNYISRWIFPSSLIINGLYEQYINGTWEKNSGEFIYNCNNKFIQQLK